MLNSDRVLNLTKTTSSTKEDTIRLLSTITSGYLVAVYADESVFSETPQHPDDQKRLLYQLFRILNSYGVLEISLSNCSSKVPREIKGTLQDIGFSIINTKVLNKRMVIRAVIHRDRHTHDTILSPLAFLDKCAKFRQRHPRKKEASFIVTVKNEALNLPHLLSFLDRIENKTGMNREFIFALNGCTDESEKILSQHIKESTLRAKVITSKQEGILPAFKAGVSARELDGLVGRFDADIVLHPHTLDLMQMHLVDHLDIKVTYAEPITLEAKTPYNEPWHNASIASKRLYYTGKTSLYQENPFLDTQILRRPVNIIADDIFTSFYFIYYFGFEAISRTPHAFVYEKVAGTFRDLIKQLSRAASEIERILQHYPEFKILSFPLEQELYPSRYKNLTRRATREIVYTDDWLRLESTK